MKANSVGWENHIELTPEEIENLIYRSIEGYIRRWNLDRYLGIIPIGIRMGQTNKNNIIELRTMPDEGEVEASRVYNIIMSKEAYQELLSRGMTGERIYGWPECKVEIYREGIQRY